MSGRGGRGSSARSSMNATSRSSNGGRGRGRGGGRSASNKVGGRGIPPSSTPKKSKQDRKAHRRSKQLEAMEKKAKEEDEYFRKCQEDAIRTSANNKRNSMNDSKTRDELFAKQGSHGINFSKYDDIKVEVKLPSGNKNSKARAMQSFDELDLPPQLKQNVSLMNYKLPTPIQRNAIPLSMAGMDSLCCAQTGSGKTCAFLLPLIASLTTTNDDKTKKNGSTRGQDLQPASPRCVVLAPTRELASQIELEAQKLTFCIPSVSPVVVYGGAPPRPQLRALAFACSTTSLIVVATPGRLTDFVDRNIVSLSDVQFLVLDEADRMLDMAPNHQACTTFRHDSQSETTDNDVQCNVSSRDSKACGRVSSSLRLDRRWKSGFHYGLHYSSFGEGDSGQAKETSACRSSAPVGSGWSNAHFFVQKKRTATWLKKQLNKGGPDDGKPNERFTPIPATDIHGDRSQSQREAALESFRSGKCRVLVATDVAARGLDISGVEHVINMDLPISREEFDSYTHRIGRTGRAGHKGDATSLFVCGDDPKVGNGKIAGLMIEQLREAGQNVPDWLEEQVAGGGGGMTPAKRKQQFGGTDVRRSSTKGGRGRPVGKSQRGGPNNSSSGRGGRGGRGGK